MPVPLPWKLQAAIRSRLGLPASASGNAWVTDESEASEFRKTNSHSPRPKKIAAPFGPPLLSAADVVRALLRFRYDPAFRGERRVPIRTLAAWVGLSHETLYEAMRAGTASECTRAKLTWALRAMAEGRLRFRRRGQHWEPQGESVSIFQATARDRSIDKSIFVVEARKF
jgi:hypothetical protein